MLPQSNASLLAVYRGGFSEDYDRPAGSTTPIWQGNIDAYSQRRIVSNFNASGELQRVLEVTLIISGDLPITLEPGDTLTYAVGNPDAPTTLAGRIQTFTNPAYLAQVPDYYKCALEETNVP
jgi:hypothetical protein